VSPADGSLVVGSGDGSVKLLRDEALRDAEILWQETPLRDLAFLAGSTNVVAAGDDGSVWMWNADDGTRVRMLQVRGGEPMLTVAVQPGKALVAVGGMSRWIRAWDAGTGSASKSFDCPGGGVASLSFSSDGSRLAAGTKRGLVRVYDAASAGMVHEMDGLAREVAAVLFLDDATTLVVAVGGTAVVHDLAGAAPARTVVHSDDELASLAWCRQLDSLIAGTAAGTIHVRGLSDGATRHEIRAHAGRVNRLVVLPDGCTLASAGRDKLVRLWDLKTGEPRATLEGHERQVFSLAASEEGRVLASGSLGGDIRLWRAGPGLPRKR
jgi:WD40 repeat protein